MKETKINDMNNESYYCKCCDYKSNKKSNFDRHLTSVKHKKMEKMQSEENVLINKDFECICGKSYKHYPSLWNHQKVCIAINDDLYYCKCCDYRCTRKFNYEKHLETDKHKQNCIAVEKDKKEEEKGEEKEFDLTKELLLIIQKLVEIIKKEKKVEKVEKVEKGGKKVEKGGKGGKGVKGGKKVEKVENINLKSGY